MRSPFSTSNQSEQTMSSGRTQALIQSWDCWMTAIICGGAPMRMSTWHRSCSEITTTLYRYVQYSTVTFRFALLSVCLDVSHFPCCILSFPLKTYGTVHNAKKSASGLSNIYPACGQRVNSWHLGTPLLPMIGPDSKPKYIRAYMSYCLASVFFYIEFSHKLMPKIQSMVTR